MANKVPEKSESDKARSKAKPRNKARPPRRRVGPEIEPTWSEADRDAANDWIAAMHAEAAATGELIVELPSHVVPGVPLPPRKRLWHDPAVSSLKWTADMFHTLAIERANDEAGAVAHVLLATLAAIEANDLEALNEPDIGPHAWARRYLREPDALPTLPIPLEDARGRLRSARQLSGGFWHLAKIVEYSIEACRLPPRPLPLKVPLAPVARPLNTTVLDRCAFSIAEVMVQSFPAVSYLSTGGHWYARAGRVAADIAPRLRVLGALKKQVPASTAALDIAETLLREACTLSDWTEADTDTAFRFLRS